MTAIAPYLSAFLREHLPRERRASPHTCEAYAYAFQLLLCFAARRLKTVPSSLELEQLDPSLILAFLEHLETGRGNSIKTRNARLAAINAFFRFLEYRLPGCLDQARRIHALPIKKTDERLIDYLNHDEIQALLDAPDATTTAGIRDRAMLHLSFAAGLRVSELVGLRLQDLEFQPQLLIHVHGKGRRERVLPLWKVTAAALRAWLAIRSDGTSHELFLNARGGAMTRSGFEYILAKHAKKATQQLPTLAKKRISPHVLRHTCATPAPCIRCKRPTMCARSHCGSAMQPCKAQNSICVPTRQRSSKPWRQAFPLSCGGGDTKSRTSCSLCCRSPNEGQIMRSHNSRRIPSRARSPPFTAHNGQLHIIAEVHRLAIEEDGIDRPSPLSHCESTCRTSSSRSTGRRRSTSWPLASVVDRRSSGEPVVASGIRAKPLGESAAVGCTGRLRRNHCFIEYSLETWMSF